MGSAELRDRLYVILTDDDAMDAGPEAVDICVGEDDDARSVAALVKSLRVAGIRQRFVVVFDDEPIGVVDIAKIGEIGAPARSGEVAHLASPTRSTVLRPVRYVCAACTRVRVFAGVMVGGLVRCRFDGVEMTVAP